MKKIMALCLLAFMALGGLAFAADDTVRIGVFLPLTGQNAFGGQLELEGVQMAHKEVNTVLGKKVEQATPDDLEYLRSCGVRLKDGDATWDDIRRERAEATGGTPPPPSGASALKAAVADGAAKAKKGAAHDQK